VTYIPPRYINEKWRWAFVRDGYVSHFAADKKPETGCIWAAIHERYPNADVDVVEGSDCDNIIEAFWDTYDD
jgi:hypothetical protein